MTGGGTRMPFDIAAMLARGTSRAERRRRRLLACCAALTTFLLLGAVNLLMIKGTEHTDWAGLVAEEGLRPGTALALVLLVIPVLALVHQSGRVAQATQERRLAALRLAGATPGDVRRLAAVEAVRIGAAGAISGGIAYVCAQRAAMAALGVRDTGRYAIALWAVPFVLVLVVAAAAAVSLLVSRHVVTSPLHVARRGTRPRPRRAALIPLAAGVALMMASTFVQWLDLGIPLLFLGAAATLLGVMTGSGRLVLEAARLTARRARTPETLLAARALEADPRATGRTMAVVGLVVAFGTGTGVIEWDVFHNASAADAPIGSFWLVSFGLTYAALLFALLVAVTALVVHRAEALLENGRSMAVLAASGAPVASLRRAAVRQTLIAATPVCAVAALATLLGMAPELATGPSPLMAAWTAGRALLMVALAVTAAAAVTAASGRLLSRAAAPEQLRTE
ncbi:FtsX-like permease family protein [Actinomadura keratinilytica]|uniref:FtsX-like permease family protein n=1 Tax=Actinomadura keratinilytica TaxID=547461 RepID=A0ABP7Y678_9ACTN